MWIGSCLGVYQSSRRKTSVCQMRDFHCGLTGNIRVLVRSTRGLLGDKNQKPKTKTSPESERAFIEDSWEEYMQILQECLKVVKSGVSKFTGSLTTSSSSTQQLCPLLTPPVWPAADFYDFVLTRGHKLSSSLENTSWSTLKRVIVLLCVAERRDVCLRPEKT